jgi:hypothetical protein
MMSVSNTQTVDSLILCLRTGIGKVGYELEEKRHVFLDVTLNIVTMLVHCKLYLKMLLTALEALTEDI